MPHAARLDPADTQLLIIDMQVKLLPLIEGHEGVLAVCARLVQTAEIFDLPITLTEQYPRGIGTTHPHILETVEGVEHTRLEKMSFSCCGNQVVAERLSTVNRKQVLIGGIEAHVCVQQTALDLLRLGWEVFVVADAVSSRDEFDYDIALLRMQQAGAIITTAESLMFELAGESGTERFKRVLELVKNSGK